MNRQALLRGMAALLLAAVISSCGDMQRPVQPGVTISRTVASPTGFKLIGGAWVIEGQAVVSLQPGFSATDFLGRHHVNQLALLVIDQTTYLLVGGTQVQDTKKLVDELRADFAVQTSDYNYGLAAPEYEGTPMSFDDHHGTLTSADYADQSQLDRTHLRQAILIANGDGVKVAVLDTGIDSGHPGWMGARIILGQDFTVRPPGPRALEVATREDSDQDGYVDEAFGHGTHVAGIVHLVAPSATLLAIKVLNSDGWGTSWGLAAGIVSAIALQSDVINLSLGLTRDAPIIRHAVSYAIGRGIGVVASAGNGGMQIDQYPASYPGVYSVTAVDGADVLARFSNFGSNVAVSAPGVQVVSLWARAPGRGLYAAGDGTSMAVPFLAGGAALFKSHQPVFDGWHAAQAVVIKSTPIDAINPTVAGLIGQGRIDLLAAVTGVEMIPDEPVIPLDPLGSGYPSIQPKP